jgi:hypothetical protein
LWTALTIGEIWVTRFKFSHKNTQNQGIKEPKLDTNSKICKWTPQMAELSSSIIITQISIFTTQQLTSNSNSNKANSSNFSSKVRLFSKNQILSRGPVSIIAWLQVKKIILMILIHPQKSMTNRAKVSKIIPSLEKWSILKWTPGWKITLKVCHRASQI